MFPLAGKEFPTSSESLAQSIRDALADVFTLPKGDATVRAEGGAYPAIDRLRIDLDGATVRATTPPQKPKAPAGRQPGVSVGRLDVQGRPIRYQQSAVDIDLTAADVRLDYARDDAGRPVLVLAAAGDGRVDVRVGKDDLQALLRAAATEGAAAQGVKIQDLQVTLTGRGDRALSADVRVKAKKAILSGTVHLTGRVDIDDDLNATLSGLDAKGEGAIGSMAAGMVKGKLKEYEGRKVSLMAFSLGDVRLRDVKIDAAGADLRVTAAFGKA